MYRLDEPPLSDDEVLAVRREIAAEVLAELAREWLPAEEQVTVAGLLRQAVELAQREG